MRLLTCGGFLGVALSLACTSMAQHSVAYSRSIYTLPDDEVIESHDRTLVPSASPGFITRFTTTPPTVEDSLMFQEGTNRIDVQGKFNLAGNSNSYAIAADAVLAAPGTGNVFAGVGAGTNITTGTGNVFLGMTAGFHDVDGRHNTFSGAFAGYTNTNLNNTFTGSYAGFSTTSGNRNVFAGDHAGYNNDAGLQNIFMGFSAGFSNTIGRDNTFLGKEAGYNNVTGSHNVFLGNSSGIDNHSGSYNIYLGNQGCGPSCDEDDHIRMGDGQSSAYIVGIYNATVAGGIALDVNSNGQLGTRTSSLRFKEQVQDVGESTSALMRLRPVTFLYKPEYDRGMHALQFGLIAEEVATVYPDLVTHGADGVPYGVRYQFLPAMLLNEIQKQHWLAEAGEKIIEEQQQEIDLLKKRLQKQEEGFQQRLSRLEGTLEK